MEKYDIGEGNIALSLKLHGVFQDVGDTLEKIINKDVVTPEIQESLLSAEHLEQEQMKVFVDERLCEPPDSDHHLHLKHPSKRMRPIHFPLCMKSCNLPRASKTLSKWTGTFYKDSL